MLRGVYTTKILSPAPNQGIRISPLKLKKNVKPLPSGNSGSIYGSIKSMISRGFQAPTGAESPPLPDRNFTSPWTNSCVRPCLNQTVNERINKLLLNELTNH